MATHLLWETGINRFYRSSFIPFFLQLNEAWNEKRGIKAEIEVKTEVQNFETARVVSQSESRENKKYSFHAEKKQFFAKPFILINGASRSPRFFAAD